MSATNRKIKKPAPRTHEGAPAVNTTKLNQLRRSVLANLLFENQFYEDGEEIAARIQRLVAENEPADVSLLALQAREQYKLRHVPLLLARELARHPKHKEEPWLVSQTIAAVIQRADELAEFVAIYWKPKKEPLSAQVKIGLANAFNKFDAYSLAKYNRDGAVKLRDVLFLTHAKPKDKAQEATWKKLVDGTLEAPDTWEVQLSAGADKKETFTRLINEQKLGALALLRNLRNMEQAGVDDKLVRAALAAADYSRVLPFRFIAAARAAKHLEADIDSAMLGALSQRAKLPGKTLLIVDVSGSMYGSPLSAKSDMDRALAGCALGAIARELCEDARVYATAGNDGTRIHKTAEVPGRHGMALVDAIHSQCSPLGGGGIFLTQVMSWLRDKEKSADRIIVITDEQDCDLSAAGAPAKAQPFGKNNYLINVASAKNGIGYKPNWVHIDGFSEQIFEYIREAEAL